MVGMGVVGIWRGGRLTGGGREMTHWHRSTTRPALPMLPRGTNCATHSISSDPCVHSICSDIGCSTVRQATKWYSKQTCKLQISTKRALKPSVKNRWKQIHSTAQHSFPFSFCDNWFVRAPKSKWYGSRLIKRLKAEHYEVHVCLHRTQTIQDSKIRFF